MIGYCDGVLDCHLEMLSTALYVPNDGFVGGITCQVMGPTSSRSLDQFCNEYLNNKELMSAYKFEGCLNDKDAQIAKENDLSQFKDSQDDIKALDK
jgi:hypothetical protein